MSDEKTTTETGGGTTSTGGTAYPVDTGIPRSALLSYALFLAGPLIWSTHFFVVYLVGEMGCTGDGPGLNVFDPPVPTLLTAVATAVAALACLGAALWAYRRGRREEKTTLLNAGALMSLLGFVTVIFVGAPALALPACG